ncbi:MAG: ABC transporter permease [Bacilli bacterium]|nr:ABC transporter permease [Bacilli bacterium]
MFKFAIKNLLIKKIQTILIVLSIMASSAVAILSYNVSNQISDGLTSNAQYYSLIVGPSGSSTQLAMNTMYFTDDPLGTIPFEVKTDLEKDSRVNLAIPFAMADQYNGYRMVGTTPEYLDGKGLKDGKMFEKTGVFEVVVGYTVAKTCDLKIGDSIYTSHSEGEEHHTPFTVTGILDRTYSSFDNICFTQLKSIWEIHEHEHEEGEEHDHEHEEHEHEDMNEMVCAILVKTKTPSAAMQLKDEYTKIATYNVEGEAKQFSIQAIEPMSVMRNVLEDTDQNQYIIYALTVVIVLMNVLVISVVTLLNMKASEKEIKLMRLIGISMGKINLIYLIQNAIIGLFSVILAFGLSRIGLLAMGSYALGKGVVLNNSVIYFTEIILLVGVFVINILPTLIWTLVQSKKDGLE